MTHKMVGCFSNESWDVQCCEDEDQPMGAASAASAAHNGHEQDAEAAYSVAVVAAKNLEPDEVNKRSSLLSLCSERSDCHHLSAPPLGKRPSNCSFTSEIDHSHRLSVGAPSMEKRVSNCSFNSETPLRDLDPLAALVSRQNSGADMGDGSMNSAMLLGPATKHDSHPALAPIEAAMARMEACMDKRLAELKNMYMAQMGGPSHVPTRPGTSSNLFHNPVHHLAVHLRGGESRSRGTTPRSSLWHHKKKDKDEDHHDIKHRFHGHKSQPQSRKPSVYGGSGIFDDEDHGHKGNHHKRHGHKDHEEVSTSHGPHPPHAPPSPNPAPRGSTMVAGPDAASQQPQPPGGSSARPKRMLKRAKTTGFNRLLKKAT